MKEDSSFLGAVALYHFAPFLEKKCETVVLKGTWGQSNQISHLPFLSGGAEEGYDIRISSPRRFQIQGQEDSHLPFVSGGAEEGGNIRISSPGRLQIQGQEGPEAKKKNLGLICKSSGFA